MTAEVELTVTLNRPRFPALNGEQLAYGLVEINLLASAGEAPPLNLAMVLDRSGSMAGVKMSKLKEAAKLTIQQLGPRDIVSVALFDERAELLIPAQPVTDEQALMRRIDAIEERGGTAISAGIQFGLGQLQQQGGAGRVSRMILLTDGETWQDEAVCRQLAQQMGDLAIPITALGLGDEWNQALLTDLAALSAGHWDYIDEPEKMVQAFQQVLTVMQGTVATNSHLILRLLAGVRPREVWRVTPLIDKLGRQVFSERDVQIDLGDLQKEGQSILVELLLPARQPGAYRLAQAEVVYDVPAGGREGQKTQRDIIFTFTGDPVSNQEAAGRVMNAVEKVSAFKFMTQALDEGKALDAVNRTRRLRAAATRLLDLGEMELAQQVQQAAGQIESGQALPARVTKRLVAETRRLDIE